MLNKKNKDIKIMAKETTYENVHLEPELNVRGEFEKLQHKFECALVDVDHRMPKCFIKIALDEALNDLAKHGTAIFSE